MRSTSMFVCILALLAGCRLEMEADIYSSDVRMVANDPSKELEVPVAFSIPILSADRCKEFIGEITKLAMNRLRKFRAESCKTVQFESFVEATAVVPLIYLNREEFQATGNIKMPTDSVLAFLAVKAPDPGRSSLGLFVDPESYSKLQARIKSQYYQTFDIEQGRATINLTNDEATSNRYRAASVFRDGEPIPIIKEFDLERRQKTRLVLSELWMAELARGGAIWPTSVLDAAE